MDLQKKWSDSLEFLGFLSILFRLQTLTRGQHIYHSTQHNYLPMGHHMGYNNSDKIMSGSLFTGLVLMTFYNITVSEILKKRLKNC